MDKIRVWQEQRGHLVKLIVKGEQEAAWLSKKLLEKDPSLEVTPLQNLPDAPLWHFCLQPKDRTSQAQLIDYLRKLKEVNLMKESALHIRELPHYRVTSNELAKWLDKQPENSWWSVDGDPLLTQRLDFPCPNDELANALRDLNQVFLLLDSRLQPTARGEMLTADQIEEAAYIDEYDNRVFQLTWETSPNADDIDWILIEDKETGSSSLGLNDQPE